MRAQNSKQLLLLWGVVDQAKRQGHPQAERAERAFDMLAALQRDHPAAVEAVLMHPAARAWAAHTLRALQGGPPRRGAVPGALAALAAAALVGSRTSGTIETFAHDGLAMLPGIGAISADGAVLVRSTAAGVRATGAGVRVDIPVGGGGDAPGWRGLRVLSTTAAGVSVRFVLDDLDPYRMPGARLCGRLPAAEVEVWRSSLSRAWEVLVRRHAGAAAEIREVTTTLTPLAPGPANGAVRSQQSASSQETFGCTALSSPTDVPTLAVTLVHEVQHAKLAALMEITPLTRPDDGRRYYAPWRDDPRPLGGLLHGAYAHMMVSRFWRTERRYATGDAAIRAHAAFARWRAAALEVAGILLGSGRLTRAGEVFVTAMTEPLTEWNAEPVPGEAMLLARRDAESHRLRAGGREALGGPLSFPSQAP